MKVHTTNYKNTFIEIAVDCPAQNGEEPPKKGDKMSVANYQYELIAENPYKYNSDEVFFSVFATRKDVSPDQLESERQKFFSKGQPCFRASPLTKRYGCGVHSNGDGKIAIFGVESAEYQDFLENKSIIKVKAMKSKR